MDCKVTSVKSPNGNPNFRQIAIPIAETPKNCLVLTIYSKFPSNFMASYYF